MAYVNSASHKSAIKMKDYTGLISLGSRVESTADGATMGQFVDVEYYDDWTLRSAAEGAHKAGSVFVINQPLVSGDVLFVTLSPTDAPIKRQTRTSYEKERFLMECRVAGKCTYLK